MADAGWRINRPLADAADYDNREIALFGPERNAWSVGSCPGEGF